MEIDYFFIVNNGLSFRRDSLSVISPLKSMDISVNTPNSNVGNLSRYGVEAAK